MRQTDMETTAIADPDALSPHPLTCAIGHQLALASEIGGRVGRILVPEAFERRTLSRRLFVLTLDGASATSIPKEVERLAEPLSSHARLALRPDLDALDGAMAEIRRLARKVPLLDHDGLSIRIALNAARPNPKIGLEVEGLVVNEDRSSRLGSHPAGEVAGMLRERIEILCRLRPTEAPLTSWLVGPPPAAVRVEAPDAGSAALKLLALRGARSFIDDDGEIRFLHLPPVARMVSPEDVVLEARACGASPWKG